jgi:hypothetical protein
MLNVMSTGVQRAEGLIFFMNSQALHLSDRQSVSPRGVNLASSKCLIKSLKHKSSMETPKNTYGLIQRITQISPRVFIPLVIIFETMT